MLPRQPDADAPMSEQQVFEAFREGLPEDWVVLHSRRFLLPAVNGRRPQEGEIDFLVLDPARGLLAIEVKGGEVQCQGGEWTSTENGRIHALEDPGSQAASGIRALDRWLQQQAPLRKARPAPSRRIAFGHGVVLPRTHVSGDLGPALPRQLILDSRDLTRPKEALDGIFAFHELTGPPLSRAAVELFVNLLLPSLGLVRALSVQVEHERAALVRLTEEQLRVLASLERNPRIAIAGGAGTGKTVLAAEKARRLAASGQRALLLCFNRPLADHLKQHAEGYDVNTFHGLCDELAQQAGLAFPVPQSDDETQRQFWEHQAPNILYEALTVLPDRRWDALIIDEGQDFRANWWESLRFALEDPENSTLYVFHDPHQNVYHGELPKDLRTLDFDLVVNCRNTARIATWCSQQIGQTPELPRGAPEGIDVEVIPCATNKAMADAIQRTLHRLLVEERIPSRNVVILSTRRRGNSCLAGRKKLGTATLVDLGEWKKNGDVVVSTFQRFKGLEADFVILCDVADGEKSSGGRQMYVAGSRARHGLVVCKATPA